MALPVQLKSKLWCYRRDLFDKAGVDPDKVTTIDDFVALAKTFHAKLPDSFAMNVKAVATSYMFHNVISSFAPVNLYDQQAQKYVIDSNPAFRTAFDVLQPLRLSSSGRRNIATTRPKREDSNTWETPWHGSKLSGKMA